MYVEDNTILEASIIKSSATSHIRVWVPSYNHGYPIRACVVCDQVHDYDKIRKNSHTYRKHDESTGKCIRWL